MQQNYNQTRFQRPRRLSKRPVPQARIRPRKAACGDHPPVEQATRPAQPSRGKAIVSAMLFK